MARTGGRNSWIAVPATMVLFALVAALVWLAVPMVPVAIGWIGDSLRGATERAAREAQLPDTAVRDPATLDCRGLYPDALWAELTWTGGVILDQDASPPATSAMGLVEALAPAVVVSCRWTRAGDGSITTTLSEVSPDAADVVVGTLRTRGFSCRVDDGAATCRSDRGDVREEHTVRDGFWLVSVEDGWQPEGYGPLVEARVFG